MIQIKNRWKLALYLPPCLILNLLIIQVFFVRRQDSLFDAFYFYYCLLLSAYFLAKGVIFIYLYLRQRKTPFLAEIKDSDWPGLTVVVPAYNEEEVIGATLASLLATDYPNLRIIVVDDGSTDKTGAIATALAQDRITYARQENLGKAQALTHGVSLVQTEYTLLVDADCLFPPHSFRQGVRYLIAQGDDAVGGALTVANPRSPLTRMQLIEYGEDTLLFRRFLSRFRWRLADRTQDVIPGALGLFRTAALRAVGPLCGEVLAEDVELTARLVEYDYRLSFCPYLVAATVAPETLGALNKQRKRWVQGYLQVTMRQLRRWRSLPSRSRYHLLFLLYKVLYWPITFTLSWIYVGRAFWIQDWYLLAVVALAQCFPFTLQGLTRFCNYDLGAHFLYSFVYGYFLLINRTYYQIHLLLFPRPRWESYHRFAPA
ncbi:MAG: glycosyltransferase family 2 protein, partial [Cyanobacteriota bacterium]|nr:glycosyltransferase family 2 protein [Cyanobacteriota bacterium]